MLHDVGKVVFATAKNGDLKADMEAHHAEVGAYLLGLWGFPNPIVEAVAFHHRPRQSTGEGLSLPALIHIAEQLVNQRHTDQDASEGTLEEGLMDKLGLADRWPAWLAELEALTSEPATA